MGSMFDVVRWTPPALPVAQVLDYKLCLPDVDELIAVIFAAASLNPEVYLDFRTAEAKEYLVRENNDAALTKGAGSA
jgi:hypothetical protein